MDQFSPTTVLKPFIETVRDDHDCDSDLDCSGNCADRTYDRQGVLVGRQETGLIARDMHFAPPLLHGISTELRAALGGDSGRKKVVQLRAETSPATKTQLSTWVYSNCHRTCAPGSHVSHCAEPSRKLIRFPLERRFQYESNSSGASNALREVFSQMVKQLLEVEESGWGHDRGGRFKLSSHETLAAAVDDMCARYQGLVERAFAGKLSGFKRKRGVFTFDRSLDFVRSEI